jgi:hypothetical protein
MRKVLGLLFFLAIGVLVLVPAPAAACRSCDNPEFWGPGTCSQGCTYCTACAICCGGDPNAGGNCEFYCSGGAIEAAVAPLQISEVLTTPATAQCSADDTDVDTAAFIVSVHTPSP